MGQAPKLRVSELTKSVFDAIKSEHLQYMTANEIVGTALLTLEKLLAENSPEVIFLRRQSQMFTISGGERQGVHPINLNQPTQEKPALEIPKVVSEEKQFSNEGHDLADLDFF